MQFSQVIYLFNQIEVFIFPVVVIATYLSLTNHVCNIHVYVDYCLAFMHIIMQYPGVCWALSCFYAYCFLKSNVPALNTDNFTVSYVSWSFHLKTTKTGSYVALKSD